jgi:hypothetical protein
MTDPKAYTTEEEKHQLALKLDQDLEEFINSRKNTPYSEGWNEETWEQVILRIVNLSKENLSNFVQCH